MVPKASDHKGHWSPLLSLHSLAKASHMATPAPANASYRIPPGENPRGRVGGKEYLVQIIHLNSTRRYMLKQIQNKHSNRYMYIHVHSGTIQRM